MLKNLEHFVQVLKIEKNHSTNTIDSYLSDIKSFEKYQAVEYKVKIEEKIILE